MIATLSAYKEMVMVSAARNTCKSTGILTERAAAFDAVDLSVSNDVFSAVDNFFNMGSSGRFDTFRKLSSDEKEQFLRIVAELAKSGYMGYEELLVNNKVERHEMSTQIGDDRLHDAKVYDAKKHITR